jgi:RND superfamily putative drug exporter
VRFIITHEGDPMSPEGIAHIDRSATPRSRPSRAPAGGSKIYLGGTAATYKDMQEGANYDLLIAGIAALP